MAGPLKSPRQERFCQELAKGKTQYMAYKRAGYKPDRGAATRLSAKVSVQNRLMELQGRAAEKAVITAAILTERLLKIVEKGESSNEAPLLSVARASIMDVAKLNGLIVNQHSGPGGGPIAFNFDLSGLTDEELDQLEGFRARIAIPGSNPGGTGSPAG